MQKSQILINFLLHPGNDSSFPGFLFANFFGILVMYNEHMEKRTATFKDSVLNAVRKIPKWSVMTYRDVAVRVGNPGAFRAVASLMKNNYDETVPCHRVVRSDGFIGEYNRVGGTATKAKRLREEGVVITAGRWKA
jgi:O-6-methylguanine DNA methyltransferase